MASSATAGAGPKEANFQRRENPNQQGFICHVTLSAVKPRHRAYPEEINTGDHLRKRRLDLGLLQRGEADWRNWVHDFILGDEPA